GGEDEHHLVLDPAAPAEDVLQHAEQLDAGQFLADLLGELPAHGVKRVLAELHVPAERALEWRVTRIDVLRHQQRPVPRPPDDRHRLEDLPGIRHRCHQPVLSRPRVSGRAYHFVTQTVEPGGQLSREFVCGEHEGGVTAAAALLIASGAIHLDLYVTGYTSIPTIGQLFLLQIIAAFVLAVAIPLTGHRLAYLAGAGFGLATLGGYLLS